MPTLLPSQDPFRSQPFHRTRRDRLTVLALLIACALATLGLASATRTADFSVVAERDV